MIANKKNIILITLVVILILIGFFVFRVKIKNWVMDLSKPSLPEAIDYQQPLVNTSPTKNSAPAITPPTMPPAQPTDEQNTNSTPPAEKIKIAASYNLNVPFTMQAPYSDWSEPWQNTCEEASILMVHYYFQQKTFTKEIAKNEILKLVEWQNQNYGNYVDTTAAETAIMVEKNWDYQTEVIDNPTVEQIKKFLNEGLPVIVPLAGRELNNPYFRAPGPIYHMAVIKGYTKDDQFIVNDPGIGKGHDYLYPFNTLMNAIHDWNEADINAGPQKALIIYPN